jgi:hypothetical protein
MTTATNTTTVTTTATTTTLAKAGKTSLYNSYNLLLYYACVMLL